MEAKEKRRKIKLKGKLISGKWKVCMNKCVGGGLLWHFRRRRWKKIILGRNIGSWMGYLVGNILPSVRKKACELDRGARG
jgi:hypothetical protein